MSRILSVAKFTILSILRFRLGIVMLVVLAAGVGGLPFIIKHNGTAEAFVQVYLTYTVGFVTLLLGLTTLWLGCSLLSRDIEESQLQLVTTKPVARWEIWAGKWLGLMGFNCALMGLSAAAIYGLLHYQAGQLTDQEKSVLHETVLVARNGITEPPQDRSLEIEAIFKERMKMEEVAKMGEELVKQKVKEDVIMMDQVVTPNHMRFWNMDLPTWRQEKLAGEKTHIRFKFHAAEFQRGALYDLSWVVATRDGAKQWETDVKLTAERIHEIAIPAGAIPERKPFRIECRNYSDLTLIFPSDTPLELLYRDGNFATNYVRAILIIICGLGLMGALGLFASSFLSFPVATFMTLSMILLFSSGNLMQEVLVENTLGNTEQEGGPSTAIRTLDKIMIPVFRFFSSTLKNFSPGSPIESLTDGRSIPTGLVVATFFKQIVIAGGFLALLGMFVLSRRELATAHSKS